MRDERAETTQPRLATQSHRIIRYLIGGWNTGLGALLAMAGLLTSDPEYTAIALITLVIGVGLLLGKRWAMWLALASTILSVMVFVASGTSYGYSAAMIQAVMFFGLIYAAPAFGEQRD